ncbi:unnamed protein product [Ambrosiozyma monospora]|uniref:Unnamed protein product n=1 Tax=Ambrosiozyma monospora TaxID=43982 RepID=A0ACB5T3K0_AMBMO|nr:unnamed protein product [Ambrosiozyma monospora]
MWNTIRIQCNYSSNLTVSLGSPKQSIPEYVVNRWLIEPIQFYLISASRFIPNSKNYPVLNKFNQLIIWKYIQRKCHNPPILLLHGVDKKDNELVTKLRSVALKHTDSETGMINVDGNEVYLGDLSYVNYLRHLLNSSLYNNQLTPVENFALNNTKPPFVDTLQSPLEPHAYNVSNTMYKVFEQDKVKYDCYERAIISALMDLVASGFQHLKGTATTPKTSKDNMNGIEYSGSSPLSQRDILKIMVVGPGRGPLIEKLFNAIRFLNLNIHKIQITAIEKNSNVMIYLNQRNEEFWANKVHIVNEDVRFWRPSNSNEQGFHLVVSELLGSFGCNELAPEVLAGLSKYRDPSLCVFIPQNLTTYISPIISPAIYRKLLDSNDPNKFNKLYIPTVETFDTPSSKAAKLWTFDFPSPTVPLPTQNATLPSTSVSTTSNSTSNTITTNTTVATAQDFPLYSYSRLGSNRDNKRQVQTTLKCRRKGTIHGLLGFFTAVLYKSIVISNNPQQPVPANLISWLPCFFPLDTPITLTDDQELSIFMKRDTDGARVWYEWSLECFIYLVLPLEKTVSRNGSINNNAALANLSALNGGVGGRSSYHDDVASNLFDQEEYQVRVRTDVSKVHNVNGNGFSFSL